MTYSRVNTGRLNGLHLLGCQKLSMDKCLPVALSDMSKSNQTLNMMILMKVTLDGFVAGRRQVRFWCDRCHLQEEEVVGIMEVITEGITGITMDNPASALAETTSFQPSLLASLELFLGHLSHH